MKKVLCLLFCFIFCFSFTACGKKSNPALEMNNKLQDFYDKVSESQGLLDTVADSIYDNWYQAIYNDKFDDDIDVAIAYAFVDNEDIVDRIEELDTEISELFKEVKDSEHGDLIKEIMSAYSDYYEFVINVSGSYNSYSANKETLKKELASTLKELSFEL